MTDQPETTPERATPIADMESDIHEAQTTEFASEVEAPVVQSVEVEVGIERSVRWGRLLLVGAVVGGVLAVMITLMFPVEEGSLYEMRQIAGFMLLIGAAFGLALGALLGFILNISAKKKRGTGVAIHTDVQ